jgi:hypothetical protein
MLLSGASDLDPEGLVRIQLLLPNSNAPRAPEFLDCQKQRALANVLLIRPVEDAGPRASKTASPGGLVKKGSSFQYARWAGDGLSDGLFPARCLFRIP